MREFLEKYGLRLLIITTACAVLISVLSFVSATSGFLQNAVGVLTYPFRSAVTAVATWAEDKQRYYKDYSDLIAENEALRERVAELERDARQAEADREENALLRELLELREQRRDLTFESAAVIDRESTNWTSALTLNRGTAHGVEKSDCVVSAEGDLVGVVSAVGYNWCTVLTVIDTDTELGARVFRTQEVAVAEGDLALMGEGKLKLSYLSADAQLLSGDVVTTSGLGGFYPGGLVIGTGDLSELALGWATYNGDHMSMYGVNASVPKTLVRHLVAHCAAEGSPPCDACWRTSSPRRSAPSCCRPKTGTSARKPRSWSAPTSCTTSICTTSCAAAIRLLSCWRRRCRHLRAYTRARRCCAGWRRFSAGFSPSSSSAPACRTARRSARSAFRRAATSACRATRPPKYGCGKSKRSKRSNANAADRANLSAASYLLKQFYRNKQYGTA